MLQVKVFEGRVNELSQQLGIKEEYKVLRYDDTYTVKMTFGVDRGFNVTKPAIFTKDAFLPLATVVSAGNGNTMQDSVEVFLSTKRGIYSMLSVTMLMCVVQGRIRRGKWLSVTCEFYAPVEIVGTRVTALRVTSTKTPSCYTLPVIDKVRDKVSSAILRDCLTREDFLVSRIL